MTDAVEVDGTGVWVPPEVVTDVAGAEMDPAREASKVDGNPVVRTEELQGFVKAVVDAQSRVIAELIGQERARGDARMEELDGNVIQYVQDVAAEIAGVVNDVIAHVNNALAEIDARAGVDDDRDSDEGDGDRDYSEDERERYRAWVLFEAARVGVKVTELAKAKKALGGGGDGDA